MHVRIHIGTHIYFSTKPQRLLNFDRAFSKIYIVCVCMCVCVRVRVRVCVCVWSERIKRHNWQPMIEHKYHSQEGLKTYLWYMECSQCVKVSCLYCSSRHQNVMYKKCKLNVTVTLSVKSNILSNTKSNYSHNSMGTCMHVIWKYIFCYGHRRFPKVNISPG